MFKCIVISKKSSPTNPISYASTFNPKSGLPKAEACRFHASVKYLQNEFDYLS